MEETSKGTDFPTKVPRKGVRIELTSYELCGVEDDSHAAQSHAYLSISRG